MTWASAYLVATKLVLCHYLPMTNTANKFSNEIRFSVPWSTDTDNGVAIVSARSGTEAIQRCKALLERTGEKANASLAYPRA